MFCFIAMCCSFCNLDLLYLSSKIEKRQTQTLYILIVFTKSSSSQYIDYAFNGLIFPQVFQTVSIFRIKNNSRQYILWQDIILEILICQSFSVLAFEFIFTEVFHWFLQTVWAHILIKHLSNMKRFINVLITNSDKYFKIHVKSSSNLRKLDMLCFFLCLI